MRVFEHEKIPELEFDLVAETTEKQRVYNTPSGKKYKSITSILSKYNKEAIMLWRQRVGEEEANRISTKASRRGTKVHDICEKYLLNEMTDMKLQMMMPDLKETFFSLKNVLDENIGKVYCLEQALYSDELEVAGRVDCIADWDNELGIIDFKTSRRLKDESKILNYFMQATAYALMFEERTGKTVNRIVVAIAVDQEDPQIFIKEKKDYIQDLMTYVKQ